MKRFLAIIASALCISLYAVEYAPIIPYTQAPMMDMRSVNNSAYMSSGSTHSPVVYEVGAYNVGTTSPAMGPRKAPPGTGGVSDYDPNNPQFAPLTDALLPLLLLALGYGVLFLPKKKSGNSVRKMT